MTHSSFFIQIQELFSKKWFFAFVLISLIFFQSVFSFLSPSSGLADGGAWESIDIFGSKFTSQSFDNFLSSKIYPLISPQYSLFTDASYYLQLSRNVSISFLDGHMYVERPLWPFLIFLSSIPVNFFITPSYGLIFGLSILLNLILMSAAALLFFSLLRNIFSLKVAWLSSIFLIFSPFVHSNLNQPTAEILMIFTVVLVLYLLINYNKRPSVSKLIFFSLIVGILMLGKMLFAVSVFILLLAIYYRRYKEGAAFLAIHLIPMLFWRLLVTQIWQITYFDLVVQRSRAGLWLFDMLQQPWYKIYQVLLETLPHFLTSLILSFLLIPVFFSVIGLKEWPLKSRNIIYFSAIFSVFSLVFIMGRYNFRQIFLLFPIIYPTCVLGIGRAADSLKKYKSQYSPIFYVIVVGFTILISNVNIYKIFNYSQGVFYGKGIFY